MAMRRNEVVEKEEQENKGNPVFGKNDNRGSAIRKNQNEDIACKGIKKKKKKGMGFVRVGRK